MKKLIKLLETKDKVLFLKAPSQFWAHVVFSSDYAEFSKKNCFELSRGKKTFDANDWFVYMLDYCK